MPTSSIITHDELVRKIMFSLYKYGLDTTQHYYIIFKYIFLLLNYCPWISRVLL